MKLKCLFLSLFLIFFISIDGEAKPKKDLNYTIFIDPGHGGYDGGARTDGLIEKTLNLSVSIYLRNYLEQAGFHVYMSRTTDVDFVDGGDGTKKKQDLERRIHMIRKSNADLMVSIHMNALINPRWRGAQTFYYPKNEQNLWLATCIQNQLILNLKNTNRTPRPIQTLYLFKVVTQPSALVEAGFLSNPEEAALLKQTAYQEKVAFAIYLGIIEYVNSLETVTIT